jgi:hypothetical protein
MILINVFCVEGERGGHPVGGNGGTLTIKRWEKEGKKRLIQKKVINK